MEIGDKTAERLLEHAQRQTKALELLVLLAEIVLFLSFLGAVVGAIAYFGS